MASRAHRRRVASNGAATPTGKRLGGVTGKGFMPGVSGNPSGRPRSAHLSNAYRAILDAVCPDDPEGRTYAEVIAEKLGKAAVAGDVAAAKELCDRTEGKAPQSLELSGNVGQIPSAGLPEKLERMVEMIAMQRAKEMGGR